MYHFAELPDNFTKRTMSYFSTAYCCFGRIAYLAAQESRASETVCHALLRLPWRAATGTERGPALVDNRELRSRSVKQIAGRDSHRHAGRNAAVRVADRAIAVACNMGAFDERFGIRRKARQAMSRPGSSFFFGKGQCGSCHMVAGRGGTNGPDLSSIGTQLTLRQLDQALVDPDRADCESLHRRRVPDGHGVPTMAGLW